MMMVHEWLEFHKDDDWFLSFLRGATNGAIQFDCGEMSIIPLYDRDTFISANPPFRKVVLQFECSQWSRATHSLAVWNELPTGEVLFIAAQRYKDREWKTVSPMVVSKSDDGRLSYGWLFKDEDKEGKQLFSEMFSLVKNVFYVLGCSNVKTQNHPAPSALNRKRLKKGKLPILEYKTLVIDLSKEESLPSKPAGGTHASPRLHLRRGHVRKLDSGKTVWVKDCVVGSTHGVVLKDYQVAPGSVVRNAENKQKGNI